MDPLKKPERGLPKDDDSRRSEQIPEKHRDPRQPSQGMPGQGGQRGRKPSED